MNDKRCRSAGGRVGAATAAALLVLTLLGACTNKERFGGQPQQEATAPPTPPPAPPPPVPPPTDLAGRWRLSVAGGGACLMTYGEAPGAAEGTIAPAGGCPGNFFTSRKWTFEHDRLIIRDFKGEVLAELAYAGGRFEGHGTAGGAVTLARP